MHEKHLKPHLQCGTDPTMIRAWSAHDPTTRETVSHPSHRRGRSSTFGDALCMEKHRVSCICYLSKAHFVRDFLQNSIGNSSTSTTCNPIYIAGTILQLQITPKFCRPHMDAEIVAADVTLRTMGIPALSNWETLTDSSPKLLFHDDNHGMIGVVRSRRNPAMRHLERIHGISFTSLHEHFSKDHFVLMYEITAKMAVDTHTKGFTNPLAWKKACILINLLDPGDLGSKQLADLVQPTTDVDTTVRQVFQSSTDEVPNFPDTETPILPPEVRTCILRVEKSFKNYLVWMP